jgi:hypothetical protein
MGECGNFIGLYRTGMDVRCYEYQVDEGLMNYEFCSEGPKGKIKKVVRFTLRNAQGTTYFNLGFGDLDSTGTQMDDKAISNNHDKEKVLTTVAQIVVEFIARYPDIGIYAKGSTPSRTRLYQMGIANNWNKIEPLLIIHGYVNNKWQPFQKNVSYEAFMAFKK